MSASRGGIDGCGSEMKAVTDADDHVSSCHHVSTMLSLHPGSCLILEGGGGGCAGEVPVSWSQCGPLYTSQPWTPPWGPFLQESRHSQFQLNQLLPLCASGSGSGSDFSFVFTFTRRILISPPCTFYFSRSSIFQFCICLHFCST